MRTPKPEHKLHVARQSASMLGRVTMLLNARKVARPRSPLGADKSGYQSDRCRHEDHPVAYLNSGSILSPSLVPPGSITFLSTNFSVSYGTTTKRVPIPRKPPTDRTAYGCLPSALTRRSSILPMVSPRSLTTLLPMTLDAR